MNRLCHHVLTVAVLLASLTAPGLAQDQAQPADADRVEAIGAFVEQGNLEAAAQACRAWWEEDPQATRPHLILGGLYIRVKLWDKAQEQFQTVLALDPTAAQAHAGLGELLRLQDRPDEARREYAEALCLDEKCGPAYLGLARLCLQADRADETQAYLEVARQVTPDDPAVPALMGELQRRAGRLPEAEASFRQALQAQPDCADALYGLAVCLQTQGNEADAQTTWDQFLSAEDTTERAWAAKWGLVQLSVKELGGAPGWNQRSVFSPDGKTIAFCAHAPGALSERTWEIWTMPADASVVPTCITEGGGSMFPRWTPDGTGLVYEYFIEPGSDRKKIFLVPAGGGEPKCLSPGVGVSAEPIPGTDQVLYTQGDEFLSVKLDGTEATPSLARPPAGWCSYATSVSPDGKSVAFSATCFPPSGLPECQLYVAPLDGLQPCRLLIADPAPGRLGPTYPSWGPDGQRILFSDDMTHPLGHQDTYAIVPGDPHLPYLLVASGARANWSPDGTKVVFDRSSPGKAGSTLFVMELGGKRLPVVKPEEADGAR